MHLCNLLAAAAAKLPFSQAVRLGDVLYLSGALGNVPGTRNVVPGGIEAETKQTMQNIGAVLKRQRSLIRRRVQTHGGTRRHRAMGNLQQGLCHLFQARPPAGAVRLSAPTVWRSARRSNLNASLMPGRSDNLG